MTTLFKTHDDEDCEQLLYIVRYLKKIKGIDIRPKYIVERNFPDYIEGILPSILLGDKDEIYKGLQEIVQYFENLLNIPNLLDITRKFRCEYSNYRICEDYSS